MGSTRFLIYPVTDSEGRLTEVCYRIEKGRISKLMLRKDGGLRTGDLCLCRVKSISANLSSAFVEIGKTMAFLPLEHDEKHPAVRGGDLLPVRVSAEAYARKLAKVSRDIGITTEAFVLEISEAARCSFSKKLNSSQKERLEALAERLTSEKQLSLSLQEKTYPLQLLFRTAAAKLTEEELYTGVLQIKNELSEYLRKAKLLPDSGVLRPTEEVYQPMYKTLAEDREALCYTEDRQVWLRLTACLPEEIAGQIRLYHDPVISLAMVYGLKRLVTRITAERVHLKSGAEIVITPTEALTVIDINSAACQRGADREKTLLAVNREAIEEIVYQIGARNISGIILVDLINLRDPQNETMLTSELASALSELRPPAKLEDITKLGLAEISRRRTSPSVYEDILLINKTILL